MPTVSLYRKYRSQTFGDLVGQDSIVRTLQSAVASGRIAHAYLFTGPRGTGKTSTARLLAKALCAENGPTAEPSDDDPICRMIAEGNCVDVIEMDAASDTGVDAVRQKIIETVEYQPMMARYKVFIIDEVHDLSSSAFDALLKTLEEPPPHVVFILATTEYNKVPPTIRSRCQKFEFRRASLADLTHRIEFVAGQESLTIEPAAVAAIARMADGGYRDALTLLEQAMIASDGPITLESIYEQLGLVPEEVTDRLLLAIQQRKVTEVLAEYDELIRRGRDPVAILESILHRLAELTRASFQVDVGHDPTREAAMHDVATRLGRDGLLELRGAFSEAHKVLRGISLPRLWFESELVRLAQGRTVAASAPVATAPAASAPPTPRPETSRVIGGNRPATPAAVDTAAKRVQVPIAPAADSPAATELWSKALAALPTQVPMRARLLDARAAGLTGDTLTLELPLKLHYTWFMEKSERRKYVSDQVSKVAGRPMVVEFRQGQVERRHDAPEAVELELEGEELAKYAREVLTDPPETNEP
ncbi:MAG: DNA polymerase III subunit gamma/tau [Fimbriimonadaceae bacterium]|nr:DNA polymerase III subunit gamma/tau [Fimbriimonadaceae bacterium]